MMEAVCSTFILNDINIGFFFFWYESMNNCLVNRNSDVSKSLAPSFWVLYRFLWGVFLLLSYPLHTLVCMAWFIAL